MKPRADVVLRKFMAGASIGNIAFQLDVEPQLVEEIVRRALNKKRKEIGK